MSRETLVNAAAGRCCCWPCRSARLRLGEPFYITLATRIADPGACSGRAQPRARPRRAGVLRPCRLLRHRRLCGGHPCQPTPSMPSRCSGRSISGTTSDAGHLAGGDRGLRPRRAAHRRVSLRTSGVYFIMITLAFAQMIYYFAISWPAYGGEDGLSMSLRNAFPGVNTASPCLTSSSAMSC